MNRIIKRYARRIYWERRGLLILAALVQHLLTMAFLLLPGFLPDGWGLAAERLFGFILLLALGPLEFGGVRIACCAYRGESIPLGELFYFYRGARRFGRAVLAALIASWPDYLISLIEDPTGRETALLSLLVFSLRILSLYWTYHAVLMPYILILDEHASVGHMRRESFRLMRGNCWQYFGLQLSFVGWYLLAFLPVCAAVFGFSMAAQAMPHWETFVYGGPFSTAPSPLMQIGGVLIMLEMTFLRPYVLLSCTAFADAVLRGRMPQLRMRAQQAQAAREPVTWEQINWEIDRWNTPDAPAANPQNRSGLQGNGGPEL